MDAYGCIRMHTDAYGCIRMHMDAYGCIWMHTCAHGCIWMHMDAYGCIWIHTDTYGIYIYKYIYILDTHMAPSGACEAAQSMAELSFGIPKGVLSFRAGILSVVLIEACCMLEQGFRGFSGCRRMLEQ